MSLEYRFLLLTKASVRYRGVRMSRAQRRDAGEGGAYYSAPRIGRGQKVTRRFLRESFVSGARRVVDAGAPAGRLASKTRAAIGRRLKKRGVGFNKAAGLRARKLARRRAERPGGIAIRDGRAYRVGQPARPFRNSLRGGQGDLMEAARMGKKPRRARKPRIAR